MKKNRKQLLTSADAIVTKKQHVSPCSDCPFSRKALPSWLSGHSSAWWLNVAHGNGRMECHTRKDCNDQAHECAGAAIFRSNVVKYTDNLKLPKDTVKVFAWDDEFATHHERRTVTKEETRKMKLAELLSRTEAEL